MELVTEYPIWFVLFCLLLGGLYSFILYFRTKKDDLQAWVQWTMASFRFVAITVIAFLLLSPLIRKNKETIEKPLIILAQDNSLSVVLSADSTYYRSQYRNDIEKLKEQLGRKYDVSVLSFGDQVATSLKTDFSEKRTDISTAFNEAMIRYANRNVGAMIMATDGIYNTGSNPFYAAGKLNFPVYTIALGDTTVLKDVILKKVNYNKTAFLGDKFPMEVLIEANKCNGVKSLLQVKKGDKLLFTKPVVFSGDRAFQKVSLTLEATEKGMQRYTVFLDVVDGEASVMNNRQDVFIDVSDTRQKIVFLYASPHPDIAAFRQALEGSSRFETEEFRIDNFNQPVEKYDLVVFDQLPTTLGYNDIAKIALKANAAMFILGSLTDLNAFNALKTGLVVNSQKASFAESTPAYNEEFSLFTLDKNIRDVVKSFPPLSCPFGGYQNSPAAEILFYQKIGTVQSRIPMALFFESTGKKTGILAGENIWKWRLSDYQQTGNHQASDELISKIVQFLSVKSDKSFFVVRTANRCLENENVEFQADVYNESYDPITQPEVNLVITDEKGKTFPFVFGKTDNGYYLNAGSFPVGTYKYQATVKVGKNLYQRSGSFIVAALNLESITTIADHNLLYRIAKAHNGEMVYPRNMDELVKKINAREDIRPVSYYHKQFSDLIGNLWVFLLILGLLTAEWFLRKRSGVY